EANIGQALGGDGLDHLAYAAGKHFAADIAGIWVSAGFKRQMFTPTVTDLDDDLFSCRKQLSRIEPAGELDLEIGQGGVEHRLLPAMQLLAGAAAEKGTRLARAGFWELVVRLGHVSRIVKKEPRHRHGGGKVHL